VAELLDILASIISGFAVPLREEHVKFFKNVIIPLHKVQTCQFYHEQLLRCSMLFLSKDPSLAIFVIILLQLNYLFLACKRTSEVLAFWKQSQGDSFLVRVIWGTWSLWYDEAWALYPPAFQKTNPLYSRLPSPSSRSCYVLFRKRLFPLNPQGLQEHHLPPSGSGYCKDSGHTLA